MKNIIYIAAILFGFFGNAQFDKVGWFLEISRQQANQTTDAYQDALLDAKFLGDDLQVGAIADWTDGDANYNYSTQASANDPSVTTRADGRQQVEFDSANSETMVMDSDYAAINYDPDNDNYTIVIAFGDITPGNSQALFTKGVFGDYQFGIATNSSGDNMTLEVGGSSFNLSGARTDVANGVWVLRRDSNGFDLLINDTEILTNQAVGATIYSETWQLAGRGNIVNQPADVAFKTVAFYHGYLSDAKLTSIYNQELP